MLVFTYFFTVMLTVLMSSTVGTLMLVRSCAQQHMSRRVALFLILLLAVGLPLAVPLAVGAIFTQLIQYLPGAGLLTMKEAASLNQAVYGSMLSSLILCGVGAVSGIRRLPPH